MNIQNNFDWRLVVERRWGKNKVRQQFAAKNNIHARILGMHSTHPYDEKFPYANQESTFLGETLNCKTETEREGS